MTSSSNSSLERGLDTMVLVYSLLRGHPAEPACEQLLRIRSGWFTSTAVIFEAKSVLTKVYGEEPLVVSQKLAQIANGPVVVLDLGPADLPAVLGLADGYALDLTDAALLHVARQNAAPYLVTDDQHLAQMCGNVGITAMSPIDSTLRQAVAAWEIQHVPPKGLPRVLRRVHSWLSQSHAQAAQDFWSKTGAASHLP
jgi:predicted nucleic acid-binding protein